MRTVGIFGCVLFAVSAISVGQTPPPLGFEAASVRPSLPGASSRFIMNETAERLNYVNVPLKWIIGCAYQLQEPRVFGPDWLTDERYDIQATYPPETSASQRNGMFQNLLAERFKVAAHFETRDIPAYVLSSGKDAPTLQTTDARPTGHQMKINGASRQITTKTSLGGLAVFLSGLLRMPVVDQTAIQGVFDITLEWIVDPVSQMSGPIRDALATQLGLKLELKKTPLEVVVVDHAERIPTEN